MSRLLSANYARLKRDKVVWLLVLFMFTFGVLRTGVALINFKYYNEILSFDSLFFNYTVMIGFLTAAFGSLFIGTEYSDGGIRNKLIVGHRRSNLYGAYLITVISVSILLCLAYIVPVSVMGIPVLGFFRIDVLTLVIYLLGSLFMVVAFSSIVTLICMLNTNKALAAVISILSILLLLVLSAYISERLSAPEFYDGIVIMDSLGNIRSESVRNAKYLEGMRREVYQFFYDSLPTGQALQYLQLQATNLWKMPLYSFLIAVIATGTGVVVFRRKDIK